MVAVEFDKKFQESCEKMVQIAFEFVDFNKKEVDTIYVFGSIEAKIFCFNFFYRINGKITEVHLLNQATSKKYDIGDEKFYAMADLGYGYLMEVDALFRKAKREVPTLLKLVYFPKTGKFNIDISYELHYTNHKEWTAGDIFNQWVEELKKSDNQDNISSQDKGWFSKLFQS